MRYFELFSIRAFRLKDFVDDHSDIKRFQNYILIPNFIHLDRNKCISV